MKLGMAAFYKKSSYHRGNRDSYYSPVNTPDGEGYAEKIHIKEEKWYRRDRESN